MAIEAGYKIYNPSEPSIEYYFDKSVGGRGIKDVVTNHNENRLELKTFGRTPYVYYAGETDYVVFDLETVFNYNEETGETARKQMEKFQAMIRLRKMLVVENSQGQSFKCDVVITEERSPSLYVQQDFDYIEVKVRCTQIDV